MLNVRLLAILSIALVMQGEALATSPVCRHDYGSPFLNALADRNIEQVQQFLANGEDPNKGINGVFPIFLSVSGISTKCASNSPSEELFRLLLGAGADINSKLSQKGDEFIHVAASLGTIPILRLTLAAGANVNARGNYGTPLFYSVMNLKTEGAEILLKAGADPNAVNSDQRTVLHEVARRPGTSNALAKLLVANGAKYQIGRVGPFFDMAEFYRGPTGGVKELIDLFVRAGGNVNEEASFAHRPGSAATPLNAGLVSTHAPLEVFEALLEKGADPNKGALYALALREDFGNVPLKRKDLVELLFRYGARIELTPRVGNIGPLENAEINRPIYANELREVMSQYRSSPGRAAR